MKIDKIKLTNYRNFESYDMTFGASTTVLIGKNGTGKTNLISAIKQSLSFIFAKKKDSGQYDFVASSDRKIASFSSTDARYGDVSNGEKDYLYPINIGVKAISNSLVFDWEFHKEKATSGLQTSKYEVANELFWRTYDGSTDIPVLAYFSDSYPHVLTNLGKNIQEMLNSGNPLPKNVAYYKWDEDKNCTEIWKQYFAMQYMKFMSTSSCKSSDFMYSVRTMLVRFSKCIVSDNNKSFAIKDLTIFPAGKNLKLQVEFENGDRSFFDQLPQGYKRILSIVLDIASRSHLLNGNCNPQGIVMIDEVELHLHPSLAQEVLQRLRETFKRLQFIVSTHSPLVITNFKQDEKNVLYKLYREDNGEYVNSQMSNLYGVDYNAGLNFMDTPERDSYIQDLVTAYKYWVEMGDKKMKGKLKEMLLKLLGEDNEVYKGL